MAIRHRLPIVLLLGVAWIVGACAPSPAPSATPATTPWGRDPVEGPTFPPPTVAGIAGAVAALDAVGSYRFTGRLTDGAESGESVTTGTVVNGEPRRAAVAYTTDGASAGGTIIIGSRTWMRLAGDDWQEQEGGAAIGEEWVNPVARLLDPYALGVDEARDLGLEDRHGVAVRHYRATVVPGAGDGDDQPTGMGFAGTLDAWLAADAGHLVAARAVGTQAWTPGDAADPGPVSTAYVLDVVVEGIDDPANAVAEPASAGPSPVAAVDREAVRLIRGIDAGLSSLGSYRFLVQTATGGFELERRITVVNRPGPAAMAETDAVAGFEGTTIVASGARTWVRTGTGAWVRGDPDGEPTCVAGADATAELGPCTFERLTDMSASLRAERRTFRVVAADETVRGIAVTHLRSDAGIAVADGTVPGTREVWIANDGGYLVRDVFTGSGVSFRAVIGRVDDPRNAVPLPGG